MNICITCIESVTCPLSTLSLPPSLTLYVCRTEISGMSMAGNKSTVMCSDPLVTLLSSPPWLALVARSSLCPSLLSLWPWLRICTLSKSQGPLYFFILISKTLTDQFCFFLFFFLLVGEGRCWARPYLCMQPLPQ